jgi:hypothetical protein
MARAPQEGVTPAVAAATADKGAARGATWEYRPAENMLQFTLPYDGARSSADQIFGALRAEAIPHRRTGDKGLIFLMTPGNVARMVQLMQEQGRLPEVAALFASLLPEWREMGERYALRATPEQVADAQKLLRRLRFTMDAKDVGAVDANITKVAPWIVQVKPGAESADMGPFGSWWISTVVRDGKPQETLWIGLEGMGREVEKLSSGSSPVPGKGWSYSFKVDQVEALVRALDRAGLLPLAMSLRAALRRVVRMSWLPLFVDNAQDFSGDIPTMPGPMVVLRTAAVDGIQRMPARAAAQRAAA